MTNTEHDESLNRSSWTGEAWLGLESMQAPKHGAVRIDWTAIRGTYTWTEQAYTSTGGSVR